MQLQDIIKTYVAQTENILKDGQPALWKTVAHVNQVQNFQAIGGLFADCGIEAQITNLTFNPIATLANMIPVFPSVYERVKFGYISDIANPTGALPIAPCDDSQIIGDVAACFAEFSFGRISFQTKTAELDSLILKANRGVRDDLYLVGAIRGTSAFISNEQASDRDFVGRSAIRRQIQLLGRSIQREVIFQFWYGDPTNLALNTASGGAKQFWGLNLLIANDYGTPAKPFVTGTNCSRLNSDIKTLPVGCFTQGTQDLYNYMSTMEATLYNRAALQGLLPVRTVIVMNHIMWQGVVEALPLQQLAFQANAIPTGSGVSGIINMDGALSASFIREQMNRTMQLSLNGRTYDVVLDSAIAVVTAGVAPTITHTSTIYFVPLTVAGESVLYWLHRDYSAFSELLAEIPGTMDIRGWTDRLSGGGALYHYAIEYIKRCFLIDVKVELALILRTPQLAGAIQNATYCRIQQLETYN